MKITIKTVQHEEHPLELANDATVEQLMNEVCKWKSVDVSWIKLIFTGKIIPPEDNTRPLTDFGITDGQFVVALIKEPKKSVPTPEPVSDPTTSDDTEEADTEEDTHVSGSIKFDTLVREMVLIMASRPEMYREIVTATPYHQSLTAEDPAAQQLIISDEFRNQVPDLVNRMLGSDEIPPDAPPSLVSAAAPIGNQAGPRHLNLGLTQEDNDAIREISLICNVNSIEVVQYYMACEKDKDRVIGMLMDMQFQ